MRRVVLLAVAALLLGASTPAASASPLTGAEKICASQGGTWNPSGSTTFPFPSCAVGLIVYSDEGTSGAARDQLTAANSACKAAGFAAAQPFGKSFVNSADGRLAFLVVQWSCVGTR